MTPLSAAAKAGRQSPNSINPRKIVVTIEGLLASGETWWFLQETQGPSTALASRKLDASSSRDDNLFPPRSAVSRRERGRKFERVIECLRWRRRQRGRECPRSRTSRPL